MRYQHPDLDVIEKFLADFGMNVVKRTEGEAWFRGYGNDQYIYYVRKGPKTFLGGTFEVESREDLEKASQLNGGSPIEPLSGAPGGGFLVTVHDPEGMPISFIHGQEPGTAGVAPEPLIVNTETDKPRKRRFHRFKEGPAAIHKVRPTSTLFRHSCLTDPSLKLGHYGLCVRDFATQLDWYTRNFNFVPSDLLTVTDEQGKDLEVAIFAHIDRGADLVDHHSIFLSQAQSSHVHHCSFEVHDLDTQQLGHRWLAAQGYESVWGVGRHILGSQIFDYWWDTSGNMVEHYADGDLVNHDTPVGRMPAGHESLAVWGPEVPETFLH
jgi:hypothetical protein